MLRKIILIVCFMVSGLINSQSTCSAFCDIYFAGTGNSLGCFNDGPTSCTRCYQQLFYLSGSSCLLRIEKNFIYNQSVEILFGGWTQNLATNIDTGTYSLTKSYFRFQRAATASLNYQIPSLNGHYGIRFRFWVYHESPIQNQMFFYINGTLDQYSLDRNLPEDSSTTWIITTNYINFTSDVVTLTFTRTDAWGTFYYCGVDDLMIIIAECVQNCVNCTSLNDCSACAPGFYLNGITHLCMSDCGPGMFEDTVANVCDFCDDNCLTCSVVSTNCQSCVDEGAKQSFLYLSVCYEVCPNNYNENYQIHTCECGNGYYLNGTGHCFACHSYCVTCFAGDEFSCNECMDGYYLQNSTTICSIYCPVGQYYREGVQIQQCYLCDAACSACQNSSTTCTACIFPTTPKYLYNHQCLPQCPDGYQQNNQTWVCDACAADTFSFKQSCISECPSPYSQSVQIAACLLSQHEGYPLDLTINVTSLTVITLHLVLELGLSSINRTHLQTDWQNRVTLTLIIQNKNELQVVGSTYSLSISSFTLQDNLIIIQTSSVSASELTPLHSFELLFSDNLYSIDNVMYTIRTNYTFSDHPENLKTMVEGYFPLYNFILLPLIVLSLLAMIFKIKYSLRGWIEYMHCIQLLGLTVYSIFPYSFSLEVYSLMIGVQYSNFSFIYNAFLNLIEPCSDCVSLSGWKFVQGDMDYLRVMGSVLQLLAFVCIVSIALYPFEKTKNYGIYLIDLVLTLIIVKSLYSWFSALLGLSYNTFTYYAIATYTLSIVLFVIFCYQQYKWKQQYGFINLRVIGLIIYAVFMAFMPIAPLLFSTVLFTWSVIEWLIIHYFNINDYGLPFICVPENSNSYEVTSNTQKKTQGLSCQEMFNRQLIRSFKPINAFLIGCVLMISQPLIILILIPSVLGIEFILLIIDTILLYQFKKEKKASHPANQTVENLQVSEIQNPDMYFSQLNKKQKKQISKDEEKSQQDNEAVVVVEEISQDDEVVRKKFSKKKSKIIDA